MSPYSTIRITRSKAIEEILKVRDDSILARMMDAILEHRLYNVEIVDDNDDNDDIVLY
jgi:hypothetical protein